MSSTAGNAGTAVPLEKNHIPRSHHFLVFLRILQLLVALAILGLSAYGISVYSTSGEGLTIFTVRNSIAPSSTEADVSGNRDHNSNHLRTRHGA